MVLTILALVALIIQMIFWLLFLWAFLRHQRKSDAPPVPVSIVVSAHDEELNLKELVPQLLGQQYPEFEVIVVEDRCNDGTYDFLLQATKEFTNLKMVRVLHKPDHINGKKYALTLGIKAAQYDWVLLTDADCRPAGKDWISTMMNQRETQTEIILGYSPYQRKPGLLNSFIRFESLLTAIQFLGFALLGRPYMGVGRNLAYKKSLFLSKKGFPYLELTGGDDDLFVNRYATRKNISVSWGQSAVMASEPKNNWSDFFTQKLRHLSVGKYYKKGDQLVLGLFIMSGLLTWFLTIPAFVIPIAPWSYWLAGIFIARLLLISTVVGVVSKRLGSAFEAWKTPFLDFIYAFYYLVTGLRALIVKKVQWKN